MVLFSWTVQPPPVTPAPLGHCRNPDEVINGDYCYFFSPFNYQSWPMARFNCNKRQMDLVSITSDEERLWVWSVMMNSRDSSGQRTAHNIWIGLTKGINSKLGKQKFLLSEYTSIHACSFRYLDHIMIQYWISSFCHYNKWTCDVKTFDEFCAYWYLWSWL